MLTNIGEMITAALSGQWGGQGQTPPIRQDEASLARMIELEAGLQDPNLAMRPEDNAFRVMANNRRSEKRAGMTSELARLQEQAIAAEQAEAQRLDMIERQRMAAEAEQAAAKAAAEREALSRMYGEDAATAIIGGFADPGDFATEDAEPDEYALRQAAASQYGLQGDEAKAFVLTGKLPTAEQAGLDWDAAGKLRKELLDSTKDFAQVTDAMGRIQASAQDPSAAGDLALIFNYMKVLDPGSTVREGEFATAENAGGIPDRLRARYNSIKRGERLSEDQRADFVNRAGALYGKAVDIYRGRRAQYDGLATRQGFDPAQIFIDRQVLEIGEPMRGGSLADMSTEELERQIAAARAAQGGR